jgi:hypothetical protein
MVNAVTHGRTGAAMLSFASVVSANEIEAVDSNIRNIYMREDRPNINDHTQENDWLDQQQMTAAFSFANGKTTISDVVSLLKLNLTNQTRTHL